MTNTIEIILQAIDKASDIILGVEKKATASNVAIAKSFEGVGIASDAVDKKLGEYGTALDKTSIAQNKLRQAQFDAQEAAQKLAQAQYNLTQNTDSTKLEGLNRELAKSQVEMDRAGQEVQKLSRDLREGKDSTEGLSGGFSKLQAGIVVVNQAMQLAGQVVQGVEQAYNATVGALINYGAKVNYLSLTLALSTEETSKLISIGQKFGVTTESITGALQMMTKRGMAPSIEALAQLSDRVMEINDPVQRAAALSEIFGRNWTSLMPILEKGGTAIKAAGEEAAKFGLVLNQSTADAIENVQIQINTLQERIDGLKIKMGGQLLPAVSEVTTAFEKLANIIGGTETPVETMQRNIEYLISIFGRESDEVKLAEKALSDYTTRMDDATGTVDAVDRAQQRAAASTAEFAQAMNMAATGAYGVSGALDETNRALERTKDAAANAKRETEGIAGAMSNLKTAMAGALQNELTNFNDNQGSLAEQAKKLKDQLAELEGKQGEVARTTVTHAMSAEQLQLANIRLAESEQRLSKETDPLKHAEIAAQIAIQRDNIEAANTAVVKYTDNSKQISSVKEQYDKVNEEIEKNAAAHENATRRILFGYAEQQLATGGLTGIEADALDALAVKWNLKSQEDIAAMNAIRKAADDLAKGGSAADFAGNVDESVTHAKAISIAQQNDAIAHGAPVTIKIATDPKQVKETTVAAIGSVNEAVRGTPPISLKTIATTDKARKDLTDFLGGSEVKAAQEPIDKKIEADTSAATTNVQYLQRYGIDPLTQAFYGLNTQVSTFIGLIGGVPSTIPLPTLPPSGGGGGSGGGSCFIAGTLVTLEDYTTKPIEQIRIGDRVLSFDESGELVANAVLDLTESESIELFEITLWNSAATCTGEHPFLAPQVDRHVEKVHGSFVRAKDLQQYDWIETLNGGQKVLSVTRRQVTPTKVYNLNVENTHTYIANGMLVHNVKVEAAMGLSDYMVPPNPRGGSGDYYPVIAAPGERVSVTPRGQDSSSGINGANFNVTLNIGGTSSSAQEIQAAVYDALNDVIKTAQEAVRA